MFLFDTTNLIVSEEYMSYSKHDHRLLLGSFYLFGFEQVSESTEISIRYVVCRIQQMLFV
jgi:hypothetical protein